MMKTEFLPHCTSPYLRASPPPPLMFPTRLPAKFRDWKRRRLKMIGRPTMSVSIERLFHGIISVFPSVNSLELIVPALGFACGAATYVLADRRSRGSDGKPAVAGDWVLLSSPTRFNRSVLLRCPTISFDDGGDLLDGVNQRLVEKDRHRVVLNRGRMSLSREDGLFEEEIVYKRLCISTEDGGVIALDWPENLDLEKEIGLDTTVLLVPGTTEGSRDRDVMVFLREALRHGCFPIVMNPRGCAGSPVITPRLFTAADSDDINATVQFIKQSRPWGTLMSVGWGYGSNMITKYLGEVGDQTSVTASVCINNPFDLDEATQSYPYGSALDQKLLHGLIDILQANKEIFHGKNKSFNIEKALSATSVVDFDRAVSMISHGSESIGEFYLKCSTRQSVRNVKIPTLFIQNNDPMVPPFLMLHNSIVENPFTNLMVFLPLNITTSECSAASWCRHLAIEWLQAVELALLKGRHPLLEDVDIPLKPSDDLLLLGTKISGSKIDGKQPFASQNTKNAKYVSKLQSNSLDGYIEDPLSYMIEGMGESQQGSISVENSSNTEININGALKKDNTVFVEETDDEKSQALTTAAMILNTLDVTTPGCLDDEQREKVLIAVNRGETLIKALQEAVPDDVRGKITGAVSEIVKSQGAGLNLSGLTKLGWDTYLKFDKKSKIEEGNKGSLKVEVSELQHQQMKVVNDEMHTDSAQYHFDAGKTIGNTASNCKIAQNPDMATSGSEMESSSGETNGEEGGTIKEVGYKQDTVIQSHKVDQPHEDGQKVTEASNDINGCRLEKAVIESDEAKQVPLTDSDTNSSPGKEENEDRRKEENGKCKADQNVSTKPESPSLPGSSSSINVSEALDAFRSFDDSTQMAVNSVFGVIENLIDQLEKKSDANLRVGTQEMDSSIVEKNKDVDSNCGNEKRDKKLMSGKENGDKEQLHSFGGYCDNDFGYEKREKDLGRLDFDSDIAESSKKSYDISEGYSKTTNPGVKWNEEIELTPNLVNSTTTYCVDGNSVEKNESAQKYALQLLVKANWELLYNVYLHRYLSSQVLHVGSIDMKKTTDLFLDREKGQWKMTDQLDSDNYSVEESRLNKKTHGQGQNPKAWLAMVDREKAFDASDLILDNTPTEIEKQSEMEPWTIGNNDMKSSSLNGKKEELTRLVRNTILDTLTIEVKRSLGVLDVDIDPELASDLEKVADTVSYAILQDNDHTLSLVNEDSSPKFGKVQGQLLVDAISYAFQNADSLRNTLPIGVIIGSSLASLHAYFDISDVSDGKQDEDNLNFNMQIKHNDQDNDSRNKFKEHNDSSFEVENNKLRVADSHANKMASALTVMCASAALAYHQKENLKETCQGIISGASIDVGESPDKKDKVEEGSQDTEDHNLASTIAGKAMSVAAPLVPTKSGGEFDSERLMIILAELGQKGGLLRFLGNVALLWGGIRGALSLTDRLIGFLRISERPLFYRIFGFVCMLLVMWSPVAVPLLPKIVQSWTANSYTGVAGYASVAGLHVATFILVMLWGKRIREYKYPLKQYGLDLSSISKAHAFLKGLIGGAMLVLLVHMVNALLGHACFVRPPNFPPYSAGATALMKAHGKLLLLFIGGSIVASCVSITEELIFRSWLPDEISADLGNHLAIVLSGLAFALFQRSLSSVPGFLFLSLALFGAKQRDHGSLYTPIGLRTGVILVSFLVQNIGFVSYDPSTPFWLTSTHSWHPFDGAVGLIFCIVLATFLYPKRPFEQEASTNSREQKGDA